MRDWRRRPRGIYHAESDEWIRTGRAVCGYRVGIGAFVSAGRPIGRACCRHCTRKLEPIVGADVASQWAQDDTREGTNDA